MKIKLFLVFVFFMISLPTFAEAYYEIAGSFYWTPMDSLSASGTTSATSSSSYYCRTNSLRNTYFRDVDLQLKAAGLSGTYDSDNKEKAFKEGKCKVITSQKVCKYPTATCTIIFNGNQYLDIAGCSMTPQTYSSLKQKGYNESQIKSYFPENRIKSDVLSGKCK